MGARTSKRVRDILFVLAVVGFVAALAKVYLEFREAADPVAQTSFSGEVSGKTILLDGKVTVEGQRLELTTYFNGNSVLLAKGDQTVEINGEPKSVMDGAEIVVFGDGRIEIVEPR